MKLLLIAWAFSLSGCAAYFDAQDPCQRAVTPSWCGSADTSTYIINGERYVVREL